MESKIWVEYEILNNNYELEAKYKQHKDLMTLFAIGMMLQQADAYNDSPYGSVLWIFHKVL